MLVLGIETSTPVSSVAIGGERGIAASVLASGARGHAEFLVPAIRSLCEQAGVPLRELGGVAAGLGPGLFTGMRVGIATAKALAQALEIPIAGVPSLDLLAHGVRHSPRLICACVDARRGEVFAAFYRQAPGGVRREGEHTVLPPEALAAEAAARSEDLLFVGDGSLAYRDRLAGGRAEFAPPGLAHPSARSLVELAAPRLARGEADPLLDFVPLYVRRADAEIKWEERGVVMGRGGARG